MTEELSWPHLLYVNGANVNYEAIQKILAQYEHCPLGPQCWILRKLDDRKGLSEALLQALPPLPEESEFWLCPLSRNWILHSKQDGFGLAAWLKKQ